jgi:hypothetical protein
MLPTPTDCESDEIVATAGTKPKPEEQRRHQHLPAHDCIVVPDEPDGGRVPDPGQLPQRTREWWHSVWRLPHCVL